MAQSKQEQEAFAKALIPYVALEGVCVVGGVLAAIFTHQMFWIVVGAIIGGAPLMLFLVRYSQKSGKR